MIVHSQVITQGTSKGSSRDPYQINNETDISSLLSLIGNKDESALSQLYDLTVSKVYSLALKILLNEADAEEVVCDVYTQLWHKAQDYQKERGAPLSWLLIICRSRALDLLRKKRPEQTCLEQSHLEKLSAEQSSFEYSSDSSLTARNNKIANQRNNTQPDDIISLMQEGTAIKEAMQQLTAIQRQLIALAFFKGLSHSEISESIQLPLGTVKSHLRRALQTMHKLIEL